MTSDPAPEDDRAAYVRALIASRCPELSDADLAALGAAPAPADTGIPPGIATQILEVVERMADRMDEFEKRFAPRPG